MPRSEANQQSHVIICGANALASRMAEELTASYGLAVTAIVPASQSGHGARLAATPGVRVLEQTELTTGVFLAAGLPTARGVAIVHQDDLGNFHAALRAQELNPAIRLVIAIFNEELGERIGEFFTDCAVLSQSQLAAPSLVAAALGKPAPQVLLGDQALQVAVRGEIGADRVLCGLADSAEASAPLLLPPDDPAAGLVLALASGSPRDPLSRVRRRRLRAPLRLLRRILWGKMGVAFAVLVAVLVVGFVLLAVYTRGISPLNAVYITFLDAAGDAVPQQSLPHWEKVAQILVTFDGLAFLPLVTAAVVSARLPGARQAAGPPPAGHVIVAGLGNIGTTIVRELHDLGFDVVGIDKDPEAAGLPLARRLGIRTVIGAAHREETLRDAGFGSCQALVSVTNDDIVNLEAALTARALAPGPRIVVRLYDDDLAERLQRTDQAADGKMVSRSTSYLAAPAFAAAVFDHQVLRTIAVGRHVLLLAEVTADGEAGLAGLQIAAVHRPGLLRVIGLRGPADADTDWCPAPDRVIGGADRVIVLATRAGLSGVLRGSARGAFDPGSPEAQATPGK
jgi:Trk K+ transport system NAD-binding subunit